MKLTSEELKSLYQGGTARLATARADCLTAEVMMQMADRAMNQVEIERAADHLATCSDCAGEFRLLPSLKPWAEEVMHTVAGSAKPALHSDTNANRPFLQGAAQRPTWREKLAAVLSPGRAAFALAASLLIILTLSGWLVLSRKENNGQIANLKEQLVEREQEVDSTKKSLDEVRRHLEKMKSEAAAKKYEGEIARLRQSMTELSSPKLNIPIVDLDPGGATRKESKEAATVIEVPATSNLVTMILNFTSQEQYSTYDVEIINQHGKQIWRGRSRRQSQANNLNVTITRQLLPGGGYLIRLFGLKNGKHEPVANYPLTIRYI